MSRKKNKKEQYRSPRVPTFSRRKYQKSGKTSRPKFEKLLFLICFPLGILSLLTAVENVYFGLLHFGVYLLFVFGAILLACPLLIAWSRNKKWTRRFIVGIYGIGFSFILSLSVFMSYHAWFHKPPADNSSPTLIVLGAALRGDQPSLMLKKRLNVAIDFLKTNQNATCIVAGGQGPDEIIPEALAMYHYMVMQGIEPSRIQQESLSTTTRENLRNAKEILPAESTGVVIVTDGFHQGRSFITAHNIGFKGLYALSAPTQLDVLPAYWLRDLAGIVPTWLEIKGFRFSSLENTRTSGGNRLLGGFHGFFNRHSVTF